MPPPRQVKIDELIQEIVAGLNDVLSLMSFQRTPDEIVEAKRFITWRRSTAWRRDLVQLVHPTEDFDALAHLEVLLRVRLTLADGREGIFDGANVRDVVKKPRSYYYLRRAFWFFSFLKCRKVHKEIVGDVRAALAWFGSYETVDGCLAKLRSGETSLGPIEPGKASGRAFTFLTELGK